MKSAEESATSSSKNLAKIRVDFFESGVGDTIIVTFPSGGIGVIDAHPSKSGSRPDILKLVEGRDILFVCLTHPHADHGLDLVPILEKHKSVAAFWHTIYDIPAFIFGMEQSANFPSPVRDAAAKMNQEWGVFFMDLLGAVGDRNINPHHLRSDLEPRVIDGVEVHCLGPEEVIQNEFFDAYRKKLKDPEAEIPDPNLISAILAFKFGDGLILLGADALKRNWDSAIERFRKRGLPKAKIFKIPHHGARNSFNFGKKGATYLDACSASPKSKGVLFAGDSKHPDPDLYERLKHRMDIFCLANGTRSPRTSNPLALDIPGARAVTSATICNPRISFELNETGEVKVLEGKMCDGCVLSR